jgi:non-ribosomal peptide synthetase-like protein
LIGVLSITPHKQVETGTSWLGSPAIFLPRRQASEKFDESLTYNPPVWLIACRLAIEFFRVILPSTLTLAAMFLFAQIMIAMLDEVAAGVALAALGAVYLGVGLLMTFVVAGLKWLLMGRYRPRVDPQWSHFVWRTELITGVYENVAVPWFFHWVAGTPFMAPALRLFGARVGKRSYFESHFITEFDLVQVGSDTAIGGHASLQTHLFEDRVMKMSKLTVGDNCSVGARSVVLYDSVLEAGAELEALSLAMKGEKLPSESRWRGIPAELVE